MPGDDLLTREALRRRVDAVAEDWRGGGTAAERAVAQRVALLWLQVYVCDLMLLKAMQAQGSNTALLKFFQGRYDQAERQFESATKTALTVRKLLTASAKNTAPPPPPKAEPPADMVPDLLALRMRPKPPKARGGSSRKSTLPESEPSRN